MQTMSGNNSQRCDFFFKRRKNNRKPNSIFPLGETSKPFWPPLPAVIFNLPACLDTRYSCPPLDQTRIFDPSCNYTHFAPVQFARRSWDRCSHSHTQTIYFYHRLARFLSHAQPIEQPDRGVNLRSLSKYDPAQFCWPGVAISMANTRKLFQARGIVVYTTVHL